MGESGVDGNGMLVLMIYRGETPYMLFFKDGLIEEKVVSIAVCCIFDDVQQGWCMCEVFFVSNPKISHTFQSLFLFGITCFF